MKIHITITDDDGVTHEGNVELTRLSKAKKKPAARPGMQTTTHSTLNFSLNARAFMSKHAKGMSGSRKFALLVAHMTKGKSDQEVSSEKIVSTWNRMKGVMGGAYNPAHGLRAKEKGWVDSAKKGSYTLSDTWKEVLAT